MTVVLYRDEDHDLFIRLVCEFEGTGEDGVPQFLAEHGVEDADQKHIDCDLSYIREEG